MFFISLSFLFDSSSFVSPSFEESHVERGGVEVDKLEDEHLHDESVVILGLCSVHLCNGETNDTRCLRHLISGDDLTDLIFQISTSNTVSDDLKTCLII